LPKQDSPAIRQPSPLARLETAMHFETMESRRMMSVTLNSNGTLRIEGSDAADVISVRQAEGKVEVSENGYLQSFDAKSVKRVIANLGAGDDVFAAHGRISKRMTIDGGDGNDQIRSGSGDDVIRGGAGNDALNAGFGRDMLDGGAGSDVIDATLATVGDFTVFIAANSRDFEPDVISCKDGERDEIRFNPNDQVDADPVDVRKPTGTFSTIPITKDPLFFPIVQE
jgi:hypothetical protein